MPCSPSAPFASSALLAFLVVLLIFGINATEISDVQKNFEKLSDLFLSFGLEVNEKVQPELTPHMGIGLVATGPISRGEVVFSIPYACMVYPWKILKHYSNFGGLITFPSDMPPVESVPVFFARIRSNVEDYDPKRSSVFRHVDFRNIQNLPQCINGHQFNRAVLDVLPPWARTAVRSFQKQANWAYKKLQEHTGSALPYDITLQQYKEGVCHRQSRMFNIKGDSALVPLADYLNHRTDGIMVSYEHPPKSNVFLMRSLVNVKRGEQIFTDYSGGTHATTSMLFQYGFIDPYPDNAGPRDRFLGEIPFEYPKIDSSDPNFEMKNNILDVLIPVESHRRFFLGYNGFNPADLDLLRLLLLADSEFSAYRVTLALSMSSLRTVKSLTPQNEEALVSFLMKKVTSAYASLETENDAVRAARRKNASNFAKEALKLRDVHYALLERQIEKMRRGDGY